MEAPLSGSGRSPLATILLWGMVAVLVLAGLLLPPISLGKRLFDTGYVKLDGDNAQTTHSDGIELSVAPARLSSSVRVKLESIPRASFTSDAAGDDWQTAAQALPAYLTLKSPVYSVDLKEEIDIPVRVGIAIPNDAQPYSLLDLYVWNGLSWRYAHSQIDVAADKIVAELDQTPRAVAVVQAGYQTPHIGMSVGSGESLPLETTGIVSQLYPAGLALGPGGVLVGEVPAFGNDASAYFQFPTTHSADTSVIQALLADTQMQQAHISALLGLLDSGNYAGLNVDYQGLPAAHQDAFTSFVTELGAQLHAAGLQLVVTTPAPLLLGENWDSAGYDWPALAQSADRILVNLPLDPAAYAENGQVDQMLTWAVSQVDRYKLLVGINAVGVHQVGGVYQAVDTAEALAPLATSLARTDGEPDELEPGGEVVVAVPTSLLVDDPTAGTHRANYSMDGQNATVWLPSAAALDLRLKVLSEYHLGGAVLNGLAGSEMVGELATALNTFLLTPKELQANTAVASVEWAVQNASGEVVGQSMGDLGNPQFAWQAADPGDYTIQGQLVLGNQMADLGSVSVSVKSPATPTPEPTSTPEPTATPAAVASSGDATPAPPPAPAVDADAVIAGQIVNLREGPGTNFGQLGQLAYGTALEILAANADGTWIKIKAGDGTQGWVYSGLCTININLSDRPVEDVPTPTPPPTPEGGSPPPPAPVVPPVSGGSFELGGHIRSWNYLGQMSSAGMNWVKLQVHYGQDTSGMIASAHSNGFKIQLSAIGGRDMVNQSNFHNDYGAWVAGMAAAGADAIEVWNEPNIEVEWPLGQISPASYTQLLCSAYNAIKGANAGTAVISAAPAPTGWFGGCSGNGCDDIPWLQGLVNAGATNCMDYVGAHHNAGATSPSARSGHPADSGGGHHSWYFLPQTEVYYNIFGGSRKLFYTEMGYASQEGVPPFSDQFSWASGINNAQQAAWLAEAASLSSSTGMVRCLIVWNLDFGRYGHDPQDGYAIIRPDGSCPACGSLAAVMGR